MEPNTLLDRLEKSIAAIGDTVSTAEFQAVIAEIVQFVQATDQRTLKDVGLLKDTFEMALQRLQSDHGASLADLKGQVDQVFVGSRLDQMQQEHQGRMQAVDSRLAEVKDGTPGKPGPKGDTGPRGPSGSPDTATQMRDKLESLEGDERLDVSAIKGLDEYVKKNSTHTVIGFNGQGGGIVKAYDLSGSLDGTTKTFALPAFWRVISVNLSSVPTVLRPTVDYTTDAAAMTITFTSEINAPTSLAAGQTCLIIYAE